MKRATAEPPPRPSPWQGEGEGGGRDFDPTRKFVRISEIRRDGFVAFDFAIGEPALYVEMMLTQAAFAEFCRVNRVIRLDGEAPATQDSGLGWRLDQATAHRPGRTHDEQEESS